MKDMEWKEKVGTESTSFLGVQAGIEPWRGKGWFGKSGARRSGTTPKVPIKLACSSGGGPRGGY